MSATNTSVLFVNHTAEIAGAERSLLDLLDGLSRRIPVSVACPEGELLDALRSRGISVLAIPAIDASFRLDPVQTPMGIAAIAASAIQVARFARRRRLSLIHANTERAGIAVSLAAFAVRIPAVVHVRTLMPEGAVAGITRLLFARAAAAIVANSRYTAQQFSGDDRLVEVIPNSIATDRFDPARIDRVIARSGLGLGPEDLALVTVGYLAPVKAQDDAIQVLAELKPHHPRVRLLIAGSARFAGSAAREDNAAYTLGLHRLARSLGVEDEVRFLGEREDIPELLRAADVVLLPSRREGFGRVAVEAMAMSVPVVATSAGGPAEVVRDGVDGLVLAPGDPKAWADAISTLLADAELRVAMGGNGRTRAIHEYGVETQVERVLGLYGRVLSGVKGR